MNSETALMRRLVVLGNVGVVFLAGCGSQPVTAVSVLPASATVQIGSPQRFTATVSPSGANQAVNWSVSGAGCADASCGTIDETGNYTAPATVPNPATVIVNATSMVDSTKAATATVIIFALPSLNPTSLAFGNQTIHTTSSPRAVALTNTGSAPAAIDSVGINGADFRDFVQTNDCPSTIAAGASCTFSVTFTPTAVGNRNSNLVINAGLADESRVPLTGTGTAGTGQGVSFAPAANYPAGSAPASVAVGDFNRDGAADLAVANGVTGTVSVLLNNSVGTFLPASEFPVPYADHITSVAVADFSHFGTFDLAVTGYGGYENGAATGSWVLHGSGDGTFRAYCFVTNGCCGIPVSQAVGEFNNDSWPDVVTANHDHIAVMMGAPGCFVFDIPPQYHAGSDSRAVAVGDFNGDGIQDLAVANGGSNNVSVLLGNPGGTFRTATNFDAGTGPSSVVVGDFNGDQIQDLAVANAGSNDVSVLLGNGDGTFQAAVNFDAGAGPSSMVVGDFNGDQIQDLGVANAGSNNVSVLLGNGDGTFQAAANFDVGGSPSSVAVDDFNGDGLPDLAVANSDSNSVSVLINNTQWH